jgi:hypothetical protein
VKRDLEHRVRWELRSDHVVTADGRVLRGRIVAESPTSIRLLQSFGGTGQLEVDLPRSELREVARESREPPAISFRDVRFNLEFPDFNFSRRPPFTIVSDQDFFRVEDAISRLGELHVEFTHAFRPLITRPERDDGIQLLFFSKKRQFEEYRKRHASELSYASGFYSFDKDRLVIFDQKSSKWARQATRQANRMKSAHRRKASRNRDLAGLEQWHRAATGSIAAESERQNRLILRHEGAHQLSFTYGVHSEHGAEHLWLIEGLASFCEAGLTGASEERATDSGSWGRFAVLVNFADKAGFGGLAEGRQRGPQEQVVDAAYTQSRFLVEHLMRNHRDGFFEYVRFVRDPANRRELRRVPRFELLGRFVGRTPAALERELQRGHARA